MNTQKNHEHRCDYHFPSGRQCRLSGSNANSGFCPRHALEERHNSDLTELLNTAHDKFRSPSGIHASLSELFTLLAENRVAPRRAAVLAYISSLMLRTLPAIQQEVAGEMAAAKNAPITTIWDIPRPSREQNGWRQPGIVRPPIAKPTASSSKPPELDGGLQEGSRCPH
jgi:hypothetical protein